MASIGLKVNHSTVGTDMASSLAKIMGSSTTDAINIARLKSELLNDEVARNAAIAADVAARQKAKRENYIHGVTIDSGSVLGKVLYDQQGRPIAPSSTSPRSSSTTTAPPATLAPEAVNATEPPEVVGEPAYAAEPDWEYRVNQHPLVSDEAPLPIELPALPPQLTGLPPDLAARPPMPPALTGLPPELLEPPAPIQLPDMPPELTGVPEDLVDRPVVGSGGIVGSGGALGGTPVIGGSPRLSGGAGQPPVGGSQTIRDMLAGMNAPARAPIPVDQTAGLELPVPVDLPPEYFTPPAALDLKPGDIPIRPPMPDTAALAGVPPELQPYPELPDTAALGGVPPELQPIPIGEPEVIKLPGRPAAPAVSPETTAATVATPSDVAAAAPAAATAAPAAGAPAAAKPAGSVGTGTVEPDGGSVYQTEEGPVRLTREETDKLGLAIAFNNDPAGQLSKLSSVLKTTYDPGVTLTPNQKAELLAGQSPIGTPEETASKIAIENAKPTKLDEGVVEIDKRKYQISIGPDGKKRVDLIAGQPTAPGGETLGGGDAAKQVEYAINLMTDKPDPATWDKGERLRYSTIMTTNFKADVKVTDSGKIVYVGGDIPAGWLPVNAVYPDGTQVKRDDTGKPIPARRAAAVPPPVPKPHQRR